MFEMLTMRTGKEQLFSEKLVSIPDYFSIENQNMVNTCNSKYKINIEKN